MGVDKACQVRITTQEAYDLGSLWIIDLNHIPYGCSVSQPVFHFRAMVVNTYTLLGLAGILEFRWVV